MLFARGVTDRVGPTAGHSPREISRFRGSLLGVVLAAEPRGLGAALVPGFLQDRGDVRVRDEALPTVGIPVEEHPDPVGLVRIAEDCRALATVLPALLGALGREDAQEAVEIFDLCRCQDHLVPPLRSRRRGSTPMVQRVCAPGCPGGMGRMPYAV